MNRWTRLLLAPLALACAGAARIRDTRTVLVLSASLSGQNLPVVFRRDGARLMHEVFGARR